jgi:hypothetical protein
VVGRSFGHVAETGASKYRSASRESDASTNLLEDYIMLRKLVVTLVAGAALAGSATTALAHGGWAFDDPYWKQQLDRPNERSSVGSRGADRYATVTGDTLTDAGGESRPGGPGFVAENEAEKARLNRAGFPQYTY